MMKLLLGHGEVNADSSGEWVSKAREAYQGAIKFVLGKRELIPFY